MASLSPPKDAPNAYDEAERGTQDVHSDTTVSTTVSAPGSIIEKVVDGREVKPPAILSSEIVPVSVPVSNVTPPKPPAKKKVSRWILWTLFFNTYRSVSIMSASLISDHASGPTH